MSPDLMPPVSISAFHGRQRGTGQRRRLLEAQMVGNCGRRRSAAIRCAAHSTPSIWPPSEFFDASIGGSVHRVQVWNEGAGDAVADLEARHARTPTASTTSPGAVAASGSPEISS